MSDNSQNNNGKPTSIELGSLLVTMIVLVARFRLGSIYTTPALQEQVPMMDALHALYRHCQCDWGEVGKDDWRMNDLSLSDGNRLLSVFSSSDGVTFWIITEADRSATTILLPDDY